MALNLAVDTNQAYVADNTTVNSDGLTVTALMPTSGAQTDVFGASATSGAAGTKVGVAGSLAVNAVANTTDAFLQGGTGSTGAQVNAGGGAILIAAGNASTGTVSAGAQVIPASTTNNTPATAGVGASVGLNVEVNTTTAEVQGGAGLTDGGTMGLNATSAKPSRPR